MVKSISLTLHNLCHSADLVHLTTRFTDELMNQGLTKQILNLVSDVSVTREFEKLQKARGLGNEKHRKEVNVFLTCCQILKLFYLFIFERYCAAFWLRKK